MKPGEIYHLEDVPPLSGGRPKGRYVVVVTRSEEVTLDLPIFVVACSSSVMPPRRGPGEVIELPWNRQGMAQTGFRKPTWAIPAWLLKVRPSQLGRRVGHIPTTKLQEIVANLPPDPRDR